eukprot:CAMPEP_0174845724 /NCGR_PEP_ID=MMETSP1114-20130205/11899_1 /TAXON_ID=312471 /ORGANISM="Neobodo designis, Strain CCAP 1951/1" /LENGTH=90 /DNA_ID=CAMNT_0016079979 /DNA_START=25 /DNA_END=293 /DNA_ORIENTATION=-
MRIRVSKIAAVLASCQHNPVVVDALSDLQEGPRLVGDGGCRVVIVPLRDDELAGYSEFEAGHQKPNAQSHIESVHHGCDLTLALGRQTKP